MYRSNHPNDPSRVAYYGNVTQMDAAIGRILNTLDSMKISDNTLVWFTSDNGPARTRWHNAGSTNNLREYKGHLYEGGIRVPGIIRWPREIEAGTVSKEPVSGIDIFQTLCEIVDVLPPTDRVLDGTSILPLFKQEKVIRDKPLFWKYLWSRSNPKFALIEGQWKLLAQLNSTETPSNVGFSRGDMELIKSGGFKDFKLYNIEDDPYEERDLAMVNADKLQELILLMEDMHAEIQDEGPIWPAWQYSRYESGRIEWPEYEAKPLNEN